MEQRLQFIGTIQSSLKRIEDCPLQESEGAPEAVLMIAPEFVEGIRNIKAGDGIMLLTWFHKADRTILATRPRNNPASPMTGVFSTRSPDRPNPIGVHLVKVISVGPNGEIKVAALEVLDQTPIIDIKPDLSAT